MTPTELQQIREKYQPLAGAAPSVDTILRLVAEIERLRKGIEKVIREGER